MIDKKKARLVAMTTEDLKTDLKYYTTDVETHLKSIIGCIIGGCISITILYLLSLNIGAMVGCVASGIFGAISLFFYHFIVAVREIVITNRIVIILIERGEL